MSEAILNDAGLFEAARKAAVSYALHGPGLVASNGGAEFTKAMETLVSVFKASIPNAARDRVAVPLRGHDWLTRAQIATQLGTAIEVAVASDGLRSMADNRTLTADDSAILEALASARETFRTVPGAWEAATGAEDPAPADDWLDRHVATVRRGQEALRAELATVAELAETFVATATAEGNELLAAPGGDPKPLQDAVADLGNLVEATRPFDAAALPTLEALADQAVVATARFSLDGRMMALAADGAFEDAESAGAKTVVAARDLELELQMMGYDTPNAIWLDHAYAKLQNVMPETSTVERARAQAIVTASLSLLENVHGRVTLQDPVLAEAVERLGESLGEAGYLLPGESENRTESLAEQSPRGTDDQILAIVAAARDVAQAAGDTEALRRAVRVTGDAGLLSGSPELIVGQPVATLKASLELAGIEADTPVTDLAIVTGETPYDFSWLHRDRIPGLAERDDESVARRLADRMDPEAYSEVLHWTQVRARNDIEAVARFHLQLAAEGVGREETVVTYASGIDMARLTDIENGRAATVMRQNAESVPFTQGEATRIVDLIESVGKIVESSYQHTQDMDSAAFPVSLAENGIEAARVLQQETSVASVLAEVSSGRRDALGLSREGANTLRRFVDVATDAMKTVIAQDDYVMKVVSESGRASDMRGLDEETGADGVALDAVADLDSEEAEGETLATRETESLKVFGDRMWDGWKDRRNADLKISQATGDKLVKRNFIAVLDGNQMRRLIDAHDALVARGVHLAVAKMAGREEVKGISLAAGVDPAGYATVQEAMGMGAGGKDGKTKASLMEERLISGMMKAKPEMTYSEFEVLTPKAQTAARPYIVQPKIAGQRPLTPRKGDPDALPVKESDPMKKNWFAELDLAPTSRAGRASDAEKRRIKAFMSKLMVKDDGEPNREFLTFLARLPDRTIVAPAPHIAEAVREFSDDYVRMLDRRREEARDRQERLRRERAGETRMTVTIAREDAKRLVQVWEASGASANGLPTMIKTDDGVAITHDDLPTVHGRVTDDKAIRNLRDKHMITLVDMQALKEGVALAAKAKWPSVDLEMENYKVVAYGPYRPVEPERAPTAPDCKVKDSEFVI